MASALLLAEGHLTRPLFGNMVRWMAAFPLPTAWVGAAKGKQIGRRKQVSDGRVSQKSRENEAIPALSVPERGRVSSVVGRRSRSAWTRMEETVPTEAVGCRIEGGQAAKTGTYVCYRPGWRADKNEPG